MDWLYDWFVEHSVALFNIILIDLTLAGDNAIVVGMAASRVAPEYRARVIFWGITGAVVLRILFSGIAVQLLQIIGLTLAGGLLLLFVAWKMYRQIVEGDMQAIHEIEADVASNAPVKGREVSFWSALWTIILADVSMSLDNVLAVAGVAQGTSEPLAILVIGLGLAIILMAVASTYIAKLLANYPWIAWLGLIIIVYVALDMIYTDSHKISCAAYNFGCSETLFQGILNRLGLKEAFGF
ncbi:YjbE family putative metal transport protein [Hyphomicrobium sp.]|uniref:YjbE family putative metal transport protein n=1 Tax=Hyphomicrobium sp. TaxID=82 RepID=UPI002CF4675A|nr:YjbE family putative metal transport protein [Hyphomicrobium sp.]HRN88467.1 YjbE family putative metal transport protein [Hyphomicrobium sp.]HRQ25572.1 YjbE family putative metal transport protein [Hyphomicrobium sp.]